MMIAINTTSPRGIDLDREANCFDFFVERIGSRDRFMMFDVAV